MASFLDIVPYLTSDGKRVDRKRERGSNEKSLRKMFSLLSRF